MNMAWKFWLLMLWAVHVLKKMLRELFYVITWTSSTNVGLGPLF